MNEEPVAADSALDLVAELRQVRAMLERELATAREQMAAASEAEGAMRAQRDQLRHTQVSAEIRLMELQRELTQLVEKTMQREEEQLSRLTSAMQGNGAMRLELGRAVDELARAHAIARNAQTEVVAYEAAQRSQISRIADLEGRIRELDPRVRELEQKLQVQVQQITKERAAYDAQAREFIRKRKEVEGRLAELAGSRSRRILMKLRLVSRCAWEK